MRQESTAATAFARDGETERSRRFWTLDSVALGCVGQGKPRDSHPRPARCETWYKSREADGIEGGIVEGARFGIWPTGS